MAKVSFAVFSDEESFCIITVTLVFVIKFLYLLERQILTMIPLTNLILALNAQHHRRMEQSTFILNLTISFHLIAVDFSLILPVFWEVSGKDE